MRNLTSQPLLLPEPVRVIKAGETGWPVGLSLLEKPPPHVQVQGCLPSLEGAVAIVGTRSADREGLRFTRELAASLAAQGVTIVSGGARGIDAAAHQGSLDGGGASVVVLPNFFDDPYPRAHRDLYRRLLSAGGALITEAVSPCAPTAFRCLARNRLIAALASRVVVVQAPVRSGALGTAAHARMLGRPLFAVPASPWDPRGQGCLGLLRRGADICVGSADILSLAASGRPNTGPQVHRSGRKSKDINVFDEDQLAVLGCLQAGALCADELCEKLAFGPDRVQRAVQTLLLFGAIDEQSGGRYGLTGR